LINFVYLDIGFPTEASYYTIGNSISEEKTYQVLTSDFSGFDNFTDEHLNEEVLNFFNILNFAFEVNSTTRIRYKLSEINDSSLTFYKDFIYVFPNVTKSWGSYPESQNLSNFLLTNRIMTNNLTLIDEYVAVNSGRLSGFSYTKDNQWFLQKYLVDSINYTINASFNNGWMTHLQFIIQNETCGLPIINFEMIEYITPPPPTDPSNIRVPLDDPNYYTINFKVNDYLILEVKDVIPKSSFFWEVGTRINIQVIEILSPGIMLNFSTTDVNGTTSSAQNYTDIFDYFIFPSYYITSNITLIEQCMNEYWNVDSNSQNMTFSFKLNDYPEPGTNKIQEHVFDRTSGWLISNNLTYENATTNEIISMLFLTAIDYSPSPPTTTTTATTTTTNDSTTVDTSPTVPTTINITPFFSISPAMLLLMLIVVIRKQKLK